MTRRLGMGVMVVVPALTKVNKATQEVFLDWINRPLQVSGQQRTVEQRAQYEGCKRGRGKGYKAISASSGSGLQNDPPRTLVNHEE